MKLGDVGYASVIYFFGIPHYSSIDHIGLSFVSFEGHVDVLLHGTSDFIWDIIV